MDSRDFNLKRLRPDMSSLIISDKMSNDERFQNLVLRPVTKVQRDLLMEVFRNYIRKHKNVFYELSTEKRFNYIENAIHRDMKFRNSLKGMIIGMFSLDEYKVYMENSSALNKRMMHIVKELFLNNIQMFESPEYLKAI